MYHDWLPAVSPPRVSVRVSLPANLATAMVLLDYASHGLATPTPWPRQFLARLDEPTRQRLRRLQPVLAHGTVLREFLLERVEPVHPAERDWAAFRDWLAVLPDRIVRELVALGTAAGLAYYRLEMDPIPEVEELVRRGGTELERWLQDVQPGGPDPCGTGSLQRLQQPGILRPALEALLASWGYGGLARQEAVELALDPPGFRDELAALLEAIWEAGWREEWAAAAGRLEEAAARGREALATGPWLGGELVLRVTGRRPAPPAGAVLQEAREVVFVPSLHLDGYLSVTRSGLGWAPAGVGTERFYVFYEPVVEEPVTGGPVRPAATAAGPAVETAAATPGGAAAARGPDHFGHVMELGNLVPALVALGDATRFAMVQLLLRTGEMYAGEVAAALQVHPSTVSRQFAQLEAAGLVRSRREGNQRFYRADAARLQAVARLLAREFGLKEL